MRVSRKIYKQLRVAPSLPFRMVVLDIDGTIWDYPKSSSELPTPFAFDDKGFTTANGIRVTLREGVREFLEACKSRGLILSIASWNTPSIPTAALEKLGLLRYFDVVKIEPHPYKDLMFEEIFSDLKAKGKSISPEEVLFIDDRQLMVDRVRARFPGVTGLVYGADFTSYQQLTDLILGKVGSKDDQKTAQGRAGMG